MATTKKKPISSKKKIPAPIETSQFVWSPVDLEDAVSGSSWLTVDGALSDATEGEFEESSEITVWEVRKVGTYKISRSVTIEEVN